MRARPRQPEREMYANDMHTPKGHWVGEASGSRAPAGRRTAFLEEDERLRSEEWQQNNSSFSSSHSFFFILHLQVQRKMQSDAFC